MGITPRPDIRRAASVQEPSGDERRPAAPLGTFLVVGDCDGLYIGEGREWLEVEVGVGPGPLCQRLLHFER
jgi:hypothetical protein